MSNIERDSKKESEATVPWPQEGFVRLPSIIAPHGPIPVCKSAWRIAAQRLDPPVGRSVARLSGSWKTMLSSSRVGASGAVTTHSSLQR
jgi:hypothetical protein